MAKIHQPVGSGKRNIPSDVITVQTLLNKCIRLLTPFRPIEVDGRFSDQLDQLIREYQRRVLAVSSPDGVIGPHGPTLRSLARQKFPPQRVNSSKLTDEDFGSAAHELNCETATIRAVAYTETRRRAFDDKGRPAILYERHKFHRLTKGKFDKEHKDLSNKTPSYVDHSYGTFSEQYSKLAEASKLDKDAANKATSWGMFQIVGENFQQAGFKSVDEFVCAMNKSEQEHLKAFVQFVKNDPILLKAIQKNDWETFAEKYNGAQYKQTHYHEQMKKNYNAFLPAKPKPATDQAAQTNGPTLRLP